jgi:hypothetical protein
VTPKTGNRNAYRSSVGKPEVKRTLESPKRRWEDNIEMDLKKKNERAWTKLSDSG